MLDGFDEFDLATTDSPCSDTTGERAARTGWRWTTRGTVTRLAVLDIVPTGEAFRRADMDFSLGYWVWSFSPPPGPYPRS